MKSKLVAMAACLLLGGLANLVEAGGGQNFACVLQAGQVFCAPQIGCRCVDGATVLITGQAITWCRDRGPKPPC